MRVLIEAFSVVIKTEEIKSKWPGGWSQFKTAVPNKTLCADGNLVRVGFMNYDDALEYSSLLEAEGITEASEEKEGGYVHISQLQGPKTRPVWMEFGHVSKSTGSNMRVAMCRLTGDQDTNVVMPEGWVYEDSVSAEPNYISNDEADERLDPIRRKDGLEVYYDKKTRKQVFVGRTKDDDKKDT